MTVTAVPAAIWSAPRAEATDAGGTAELSPAPPLVVPTSPDQWFAPSGRNEGTEGLVDFLARLALTGNSPLAITSGWGRTFGPATSDHHATQPNTWANDLAIPGVSVPTDTTDVAARRIASALGEPEWTHGNLVKTVNGYRFQLLWRTSGHYDHVHIGVRKVQ